MSQSSQVSRYSFFCTGAWAQDLRLCRRFLICSLWVSSVSSCNFFSSYFDPFGPISTSGKQPQCTSCTSFTSCTSCPSIYIYTCVLSVNSVLGIAVIEDLKTHTHIGHGTDTSSEHDLNFMLCNWVCPQAVGTPNFHDLFFHLHMAVWTIFFSDRPKFQCW